MVLGTIIGDYLRVVIGLLRGVGGTVIGDYLRVVIRITSPFFFEHISGDGQQLAHARSNATCSQEANLDQ